jgi:hypothetical protein
MRLQRLTPGMQNAQEAEFRPEMFGIGGDFEQRGGTGFKQQREEGSFVLPHQRDQAVRHAEDEVVISDRKKFLLSCSQPFITSIGLALRTMTVPAGVVRDGLMTAAVTLIAMTAQGRCTTACNGVHHLDLWPGE